MRILVMGAGAIGSAVGGFMCRAGHDVTLIGRDPQMNAIADAGLRISGIWGDHHVSGLDARTDMPESGEYNAIIIAVKSFDTASAIDACASLAGPNTIVYAYQNGLGNADAIADRVGWKRTAGVRAIYGVRIDEPGAIRITVIAEPTAIGPLHDSTPAEPLCEMAEAMNDAGLPTVYDDAVAATIWRKVAYNCALNPLSALLDVPYGALADHHDTRHAMETVIHELYGVAGKRGVNMTPGTPAEYIRHFYDELLPPTAAHFASMREDLRNGKRTEIDALNGAIAVYAQELGADAPMNALLTRLIHAAEGR